jgi:hypothetical protein
MDSLNSPISQRKAVMVWLENVLRKGRQPAAEIIVQVLLSGHNKSTLYRAKKALGIVSERTGMGPGAVWYWKLPESEI